MADTMAQAYIHGLEELLDKGLTVSSVLSPKSKASNFGEGNRPWAEIIAHNFTALNDVPQIIGTSALPTHVAYTIGLLAWTLDARNDVHSLAYYRQAARDFSDDGDTMCGAFGARIYGLSHSHDQLDAIVARLHRDPSSRRTFASIIEPSDNITETLEYPCAAGVQLFLRNSKLHWLTVMRAQQALTVLPYDLALFSILHHFIASSLAVPVGDYHHFAGTFHIYDNEIPVARRLISSDAIVKKFPPLPSGTGNDVAAELVRLETKVRIAGSAGDEPALNRLAVEPVSFEFNAMARDLLVTFARTKI